MKGFKGLADLFPLRAGFRPQFFVGIPSMLADAFRRNAHHSGNLLATQLAKFQKQLGIFARRNAGRAFCLLGRDPFRKDAGVFRIPGLLRNQSRKFRLGNFFFRRHREVEKRGL